MHKKNRILHVPTGVKAATLQGFLSEQLTLSARAAKRIIDERRILVNGNRIWMARHRLHGGEQIEILPPEQQEKKQIAIIYRDDKLLVADKPAGMLSNGENSLETRLRSQLELPSLRAVHRLDRGTSGCLLFTASNAIYAALVEEFRSRKVLKIYHAIVAGTWNTHERQLRAKLDDLDAITSVRVLDSCADASHVAVRIETGRTHQIRRHLELAGYPVLGDREHGRQRLADPRFRTVPRQMLHNTVLEFNHPEGRRRIRATSPLPPDFNACLHMFRMK